MIIIRIIKQELNISPILKKKITWASKYTNFDIKIEKGNLIRLEPTNIAYVEPHKVIINENTFMFFNEKDMFCINILNKQKDRIKKVQTTGVVELDDFKQDLKIINEKLDMFNSKKERKKMIVLNYKV